MKWKESDKATFAGVFMKEESRKEYCDTLFRVLTREHDAADKLVKECSTQSLDAIHTFDIDIERNLDKCPGRRFDMFKENSFQLRQDFVNNCVCKRKSL